MSDPGQTKCMGFVSIHTPTAIASMPNSGKMEMLLGFAETVSIVTC